MNIMIIPYLPTAVRAKPMARYFCSAGNNVHLILWDMPYPINLATLLMSFRNSFKYQKSNADGVTIHKIRRFPFFFPLINRPLFKNQIRSIFKQNAIDLIISESYFSETEPPLELPIIYDISDDHEAFAEIYGSTIYKLAYKFLSVRKTIVNQIKHSIAVTVVSDLLMQYALKYRQSDVYKITNGVEDWVIDTPVISGKTHSVGYVSNFGKWSKLDKLIQAINKLKPEFPDITLTLIGDGEELQHAKEQVQQLGMGSNVTFLGFIDNRKKVIEEVNNWDVCINISDKNKFRDSASPMKVFDYSALGKKIVSSELSEVKILELKNVVFCNNTDSTNDIAKAIREAFLMKVDAMKVKNDIAQYSWTSIIGMYKKIYDEKIRKI